MAAFVYVAPRARFSSLVRIQTCGGGLKFQLRCLVDQKWSGKSSLCIANQSVATLSVVNAKLFL